MKRLLPALLLVLAPLSAQRVVESTLSLTAREERCTTGKPIAELSAAERQVFFRFLLRNASNLSGLTVEWLAPGAQVVDFVNYEQLPVAATMCLLTQLPIAGFPAADKPGEWSVRVTAHGRVIAERKFVLKPDPAASAAVHIRSIQRVERGPLETDLILEGRGLSGESGIHLAAYTEANSWQFLASMQPVAVEPNRITVKFPGHLNPGEYWLVAKNLDNAQSAPARLLVASDTGYALPVAAGEQWIISQGPYGGTSHWGRSLHAWDIAPVNLRAGGCVTAMRPGIVHAFDRGERQNSFSRSFGNYITIQHDDGEFSHYAHLRTGTFVVRTGQRVVAGQALATVGNSGHTLGMNGGYHVHAHVTNAFPIASQSIPFTYSNFPNAARGQVIVNNIPLVGSCAAAFDGSVDVSRRETGPGKPESGKPETGPQWRGQVAVTEWWTEVVNVPRGAKALDVLVAWQNKQTDRLDVYLTSPSGNQYGGPYANPERLRVEEPETGNWRISIQGVRGNGAPIAFEVQGKIAR